jgi:uncharacterized protein (DUF885 family)
MMVSMLKKPSIALCAVLLVFGSVSCATREPADELLTALLDPFVFDSLAMTPIAATAAGYHEHVRGGEGEEGAAATITPLDEMLDDYSADGIAKRIAAYKDFQSKLTSTVIRDELKGGEWADYRVVEQHVAQVLFTLQKERVHEHNPTLYVEALGTALFTPLVHEYGPPEERYRHIIARLEKVPAFLEQAKQNLESSPELWTQTAIAENAGNINLVETVIPAGLPDSLKSDYDRASGPALDALRGFSDYLKSNLGGSHDWRLGRDLYAEKFKLFVSGKKTPDQLLAQAEAELQATYDEIIAAARPVHKEIFGNQRPPNDMALMKDVLEVIGDDHRIRRGSQLIDQIKKDVDELRKSVEDAGIVLSPPRNNLQIIDTPEFMRGIYSVAGFMGAPVIEPQLGAYYWVTPIPSDWPRARVASKLREYNLFALKLLSLHEVMPGHYVQSEFSNEGHEDLSKTRRILRSVYANGAYVEGWATYITEAVVDAGYQNKSQEFQVNWLKHKLRVQANAILDIRMHTMNMSDDEAEELLRTKAFQEAEEIRGKIARAKLSSAQLPLYYHGWKQWVRVREHYQAETTDFSLTSFHDKALREGPMPLPELGYLVTQRPMPD